MKTKSILIALVVATASALPVCLHADGGWHGRKWDPSKADSLPVISLPSAFNAASLSATGGSSVPRVAKKVVKSFAAKSMLASTAVTKFSSAGLSGTLPNADDSRIRELARGLDHDWGRCFDFVRNNIRYTPYPGIMKGPERTLLDGEGNAADQSLLLCALLRASGYDSATVLYMPLKTEPSMDSVFIVPLFNWDGQTPYNASAWLGVNSENELRLKLNSNGLAAFKFGDYLLCIEHYWVRVVIDGEIVHLDPSFKPQPRTTGQDARAASGYDRSSFLAAAGGTVDANSAKNLSEQGVGDYLKARVAEIKAAWNKPGASPSSVLGTTKITPRALNDPRFHGDVRINGSTEPIHLLDVFEPIDLLASSSADTLDSLRTKVKIDNYGYDFEKTGEPVHLYFYLDEVGPRTLWFAKDADDELGFFVEEAEVSHSEYWKFLGASLIGVNVECDGRSSYHSYVMRPEDGHVHVLSVNLGGDRSDGIRKVITKRISKLKAQGLSDRDDLMRATLLHLQGQQWLSQVEGHHRVWSRVLGGERSHFYNIGIAGQTEGPFVDMANSYARGYGSANLVESHMMFSSALEHSVIEQLNGADNEAVSTVKILKLANASGNPIYFANSNNVESVISSLSGYTDDLKSSFTAAAAKGEIYLLPQNATVTLNKWTGTGYLEHGMDERGVYHTGMIISGGMNGGYCANEKNPDSESYVENSSRNTDTQRADVNSSTQADPVVMPAGAYVDNKVDLAVQRAVPLSWTRSYDTRSSETSGDLGRGWTHGFDASIVESSDVDAALGESSLDAVLPAVVASLVADDMMSETAGLSPGEIARRWTAAALVANWWSKQLPQTSVAVKMGATMLSFQCMPDGTYAPAPGVTAMLSRDANGLYSLKERHGNTYAFNSDKKLASITDPSGNRTTLVYANGVLSRVENSFGASMTIVRDGTGRIVSVTDNSGKSVSYSYDASGCMISATDAAGEVWPYSYDSKTHLMVAKKNPNGDYLIRNAYNEYGQVTNQVSSNGGVWRLGYVASVEAWNEDPKGGRLTETFDSDGRVLLRTERDGSTAALAYDGHGNVAEARDTLGTRTTFAYDVRDNLITSIQTSEFLSRTKRMGYDALDHLIAVTNALGHVTTYDYDACDRMTRKTAPDGTCTVNDWNANGTLAAKHFRDSSGATLRSVLTTYNAFGLATARTITGVGLPAGGATVQTEYNDDGTVSAKVYPRGNRTTFAYDQAGRLISTTDPAGESSTLGYNKIGEISVTRDALGREMRMNYNQSGLLEQTTLPNGAVKVFEYDELDDVIAETDERGARRTTERDSMSRPIVVTDSLGGSNEFEYDSLGRIVMAKDAAGVRRWWEYDGFSRPVVKTDAFGAKWQTDYDKLDRVVASTSPIGKTSRFAYDAVGSLVSASRPSSAVDSFGHDAMGNLTTYTNAEGRVYRLTYDALGRVKTLTNARGVQVAEKAYDLNGNLVTLKDGNDAVCSYGYDVNDRLVSRTTSKGSDTFGYDAVGNLVSAANETAVETFAYDDLDRLVGATTEVAGLTVHNGWHRDAGGLVTNVVYSSGKSVAKVYDSEGRLVSVSDWLGHVWGFSWNGAGRLVRVTSPDGRTRSQTYDAAGRLAAWSVGDVLGRTLVYDLSGRKTSESVVAGTMPTPKANRHAKNAFDAADRLVSSTVELGDGETRTESYSYDGNDAMIRAVSGGEDVAFDYNADGTLAGYEVKGLMTGFGYDALGNRILSDGHVFIPDQNDALKRPLLEYDAQGQLVRAYIWAGGMLLGYLDAVNALTVAHVDEMGGVAVLSYANGTIFHTAHYGPHGEDWGRTGSNPTPFAWLGGFGVQSLPCQTFMGDLYLTRHRLYSPAQQRFLSVDPMGLSGGLNLFAYGKGNPLAYIDPLGLCAEKKDKEDFFDWLYNFCIGVENAWVKSREGLGKMFGAGKDAASKVSKTGAVLSTVAPGTDVAQAYSKTLGKTAGTAGTVFSFADAAVNPNYTESEREKLYCDTAVGVARRTVLSAPVNAGATVVEMAMEGTEQSVLNAAKHTLVNIRNRYDEAGVPMVVPTEDLNKKRETKDWFRKGD